MDEEDRIRLELERADKRHQEEIGVHHYCNGCGWPADFCICHLDEIVAEMEDRAGHGES